MLFELLSEYSLNYKASNVKIIYYYAQNIQLQVNQIISFLSSIKFRLLYDIARL